jgi:type III secretion protein R
MLVQNPLAMIAIFILVAALPLLAVMVTAFAKLSIVMLIVRNAVGVQQLPPNIVIYTLCFILSAYISLPMLTESYRMVRDSGLGFATLGELEQVATIAGKPLAAFLSKHADPRQVAFFVDATTRLWGPETGIEVNEQSFAVLVPGFLVSELNKAFQIGFMLYLPFMAIDLVITTMLVALGMMMVQPTVIAIPFKIMLFVFLDGWTRIIHGLILSYGSGQ